MATLFFSAAARDDLREIVDYIARDKPEAALRWLERIRTKCELHAANPEMGERCPHLLSGDCRCFSFGSYVIFFREIAGGIEVARVVRGERDLREL